MELLPLLLIAELWLFDLLLDRVSQFLVLGRTTTKGTSLATFEHFRLDTMEWRHESQWIWQIVGGYVVPLGLLVAQWNKCSAAKIQNKFISDNVHARFPIFYDSSDSSRQDNIRTS